MPTSAHPAPVKQTAVALQHLPRASLGLVNGGFDVRGSTKTMPPKMISAPLNTGFEKMYYQKAENLVRPGAFHIVPTGPRQSPSIEKARLLPFIVRRPNLPAIYDQSPILSTENSSILVAVPTTIFHQVEREAETLMVLDIRRGTKGRRPDGVVWLDIRIPHGT
jgi:hypothetical protein